MQAFARVTGVAAPLPGASTDTDVVMPQAARFLVVGPNFGCGSSREHAVRGLLQPGVQALIGTGFAGIFADNAANDGLLLMELEPARVAALLDRAADPECHVMTVDLASQAVAASGLAFGVAIDPLRRHRLLRGPDPIGATPEHAGAIRAFEHARHAGSPWPGAAGSSR